MAGSIAKRPSLSLEDIDSLPARPPRAYIENIGLGLQVSRFARRLLLQITKKIEAEASFAFGHSQIVRRVWNEPIDVVGMPTEHRLEFAMLPRSAAARGCFPGYRDVSHFDRFGELFFFPAGRVVHAKSRCRHQFSVVCSFRPEAVEFWFDGGLQWTQARLRAGLT